MAQQITWQNVNVPSMSDATQAYTQGAEFIRDGFKGLSEFGQDRQKAIQQQVTDAKEAEETGNQRSFEQALMGLAADENLNEKQLMGEGLRLGEKFGRDRDASMNAIRDAVTFRNQADEYTAEQQGALTGLQDIVTQEEQRGQQEVEAGLAVYDSQTPQGNRPGLLDTVSSQGLDPSQELNRLKSELPNDANAWFSGHKAGESYDDWEADMLQKGYHPAAMSMAFREQVPRDTRTGFLGLNKGKTIDTNKLEDRIKFLDNQIKEEAEAKANRQAYKIRLENQFLTDSNAGLAEARKNLSSAQSNFRRQNRRDVFGLQE